MACPDPLVRPHRQRPKLPRRSRRPSLRPAATNRSQNITTHLRRTTALSGTEARRFARTLLEGETLHVTFGDPKNIDTLCGMLSAIGASVEFFEIAAPP